MMAKFTKAPDLEIKVGGIVKKEIDRLLEDVRRRAESLSPPLSEWRSMGDDKVRPEHRGVEGQKVPEGLRFEMKSDEWDQDHRGVGEHTYLLYPRDKSCRAYVAVTNCRCRTTPAGKFQFLIDGPNISRSKVDGSVYTNDQWAKEAEFGTSYPDGNYSPPQRFMAKAAQQAGAAF